MLESWLGSDAMSGWSGTLIGSAIVIVLCGLLYVLTTRYLVRGARALVRRSRMQWDEVLFEQRVLRRFALIIPLLAAQVGVAWIPGLSAGVQTILQRLLGAGMILVTALTIVAFLSAAHSLYLRMSVSETRPIKSYIQLAQIFVYIVAAIFIIARLVERSPWFFVSGIGAMMAVVLLIFRDTLLSLVASVQLTSNDLVRVGDWIEMPQFNADGDVVDIALNTVTVKNWDKTVTVIPTHKFLEHSFKNWRAMFEGGGRRIKRSIHINTSTTRFLTDEEIERFSRFALLHDYVEEKKRELAEYNATFADDPSLVPNARRLTNIGMLRAYITAYLRNHPNIHQEMTFLVRQLEPTPEGLPIQIYVFTNDTRWAYYEGIQADVFDHILSMMPEFGLRVYQRPSGHDLVLAGGGATNAVASDA